MKNWWFKNKWLQIISFFKYIKLLPDLRLRTFVVILFSSLIIISFFSGLLIGKNIESKNSIKITNGIKHVPYDNKLLDKVLYGKNDMYAKNDAEKNFVASDGGKVYYFKSCKGYTRIKEENRVWFKTDNDAKLSGYKLAKNCNYR